MRNLVGDPLGSTAHHAALGHLKAGGRRFRARLAIDAGLALSLDSTHISAVAAAVELVHNASLIHDDLQDRDETRRHAPAVWAEFGDAVAVLSGDLMLSAAYAALASTGNAAGPLIQRLHHRIGELIRGQDADPTKPNTHLDLAAYETIAAGKSGPLLILPMELCLHLADCADSSATAEECGRHFAIGYQMFDDLRDVANDKAKGSLNAVLIMAGCGHNHPEACVTNLATEHFRQAQILSRNLPAECGRLLAWMAYRLSRRLLGEPPA
jgi:geranylgeranyl pyrophosphate synthase